MQIVIDIYEKDYRSALNGVLTYSAIYSFTHGTVLPENQGRLIDADVLADGLEDNYEFCEIVNATPTIIDAHERKC
jgi:hypothetical protein